MAFSSSSAKSNAIAISKKEVGALGAIFRDFILAIYRFISCLIVTCNVLGSP